jgi:ATP-binding cassette subfamily C protein
VNDSLRPLDTTVAFVRLLATMLGWRLAASVGAALALACAEGAGLLLLVPLLGTIGLAVDEGPTGRLAALASCGFEWAGVTPTLPTVLGVFLVVSTAHAWLYRTHMLLNPSIEQAVTVGLRERLYSAIVSARWPFLVQRRTPDLVHAVTMDVDRLGGATYQLLTLVAGFAVTSVYVIIAARLSLALTGLVVVGGLTMLWLLKNRTRDSGERGDEYAQASRRLFAMASESIAGLKVAKSLGAEPRHIAIFGAHARSLSTAYLELLRSYARAKVRLDVASALLVSLLLLLAVEVLGLTGAGLLVLVFIFARIMPRVMALQEAAQVFLGALPSFANVMRTIEVCEAESEDAGGLPGPRLALGDGVALDGVTFGYGPGSPVLTDVSLRIRVGSVTALAGASGAGKSTVADVLMGLLRPGAGRVIVGGHTLDDSDVRRWRQSIGYVPQDTFLLHDTVRANLLWARPGATEHEMWTALDRAAAGDFLRARAEGLDTVVGDRGVRLSGGERQRLALARALILQPDLLVLDEATSALDSANERQILSAVHQLAGTLTVLIITHRLSTLKGAGVVYVMDAGRVVESGTWTELAGRPDGALRALLEAQAHDVPLGPHET